MRRFYYGYKYMGLLHTGRLHGEKINRMEPSDELLFEACRKLDLEGITQAIKEGVNPKALNKFGQSTIYQCVDTCVNYCGMSEIPGLNR